MGKVLVFNYDFIPYDNRVYKIAQSISESGHKVIILCIGYNFQIPTEIIDHIKVIRLFPMKKFGDRESLFLILKFWILSFFYSIYLKPDILHVNDPTALPGAGLYSILTNKDLVYDSHELFPENSREVLGYVSYLIFYAIEVIFTLKAILLLSVSDILTDFIGTRLRIYNRITVRNIPDLPPVQKCTNSNDGVVRFIYAGSIQPHRGYDELIDAVEILENDHPNLRFSVRVVGDGPNLDYYREIIKKKNLHKIEFIGFRPFKRYIEEINMSDVGLVLFSGTIYQRLSVPIQVYEYLMLEKFIVANKVLEKAFSTNLKLKIIDLEKVFFFYDSQTPNSIALTMMSIVNLFDINREDLIERRDQLFSSNNSLGDLDWCHEVVKVKMFYGSLAIGN